MSKEENTTQKNTAKKKTTVWTVLYRLVVLCLVGVIVVSGYNVLTTANNYRKARKEYDHISEIALVDPTQFTGEIDWKALRDVNPDVCGWIYLRNSVINYPVAKGKDNDLYLHHLIDGSYNFAGTIFVDCHCKDGFEGFNTIVYGHHMKDGSMFAPLAKYVTTSDYYEDHKVFEYITPDEKYHLQVFAAFVTDADSRVYDFSFRDDEAAQSHLDMLFAADQTGADPVEVSPEDRIVTLSTCVDAEGPARYVVVGKLIPWTDEEKEEALRIEQSKR